MPVPNPIQISIINASTVLQDADVVPVVAALQKQVSVDFYPVWGVDATLTFIPTGSTAPAGTWWLTIFDDSDQAGALGYHDITPDGLPLGKVFAGTDLKFGYTWSITTSHELLEMLVDPNINLTVLVQTTDQNAGTLYAYEVSDACEADALGYDIDGVMVSDFVYPSWFESFRTKGSAQFDQTKHLNAPFELAKGGYIGAFDITAGSGWHQVTAEKHLTSMALRGAVGTRRERRSIPRSQWIPTVLPAEISKRAKQYESRVRKLHMVKAA
jgi:hypothetical protein